MVKAHHARSLAVKRWDTTLASPPARALHGLHARALRSYHFDVPGLFPSKRTTAFRSAISWAVLALAIAIGQFGRTDADMGRYKDRSTAQQRPHWLRFRLQSPARSIRSSVRWRREAAAIRQPHQGGRNLATPAASADLVATSPLTRTRAAARSGSRGP